MSTSTGDCPDGDSIELIIVDGSGQLSPDSAGARGLRPAFAALSSTYTVWQFFAGHSR